MIEARPPVTWKELQRLVSQILSESGVENAIERTIETARGMVEIDVWAHDDSATPPQTYLIECKLWRKAVPKTVVHAFRTVVGDSGANWGAIVSSTGYQRGAVEAARYTNVRLLTWEQFQELFAIRWHERYFVPSLSRGTAALTEYTEPINSRIFRKAYALSKEMRGQFIALRKKHEDLASLCLALKAGTLLRLASGYDGKFGLPVAPPKLPLRDRFNQQPERPSFSIPAEILDAVSLRPLLELILRHAEKATAEFDEVFGERA